VRCSRMGTKSFDLEYEIVKLLSNGEKQTASTGSTVIVAFNYKEQKAIAVPDTWKKNIAAFEHNQELAK
jgi:acyl-CoA thioesterase FadM